MVATQMEGRLSNLKLSNTPSLLAHLPSELVDVVLTHVPPELLQRTAASLIQVFPDYPLSSRHLWTHVVVVKAKQLLPLWKRLRLEQKKEHGVEKGVRTFCQQSWQGDADILNKCLPAVRVLMLNVGTNFAPEHLEEMFENSRMDLRRLEIRFRPYVEQASYYQFLKGSYFDTAVETLYRRWHEVPSFTHLALVQDIPPRLVKKTTKKAIFGARETLPETIESDSSDSEVDDPAIKADYELPVEPRGYSGHGPFPYVSEKMNYAKPKTFAQPIVFFDIRCISRLAVADVAKHITHFRLRVPSRDIASILIVPPPSTDGIKRQMFPRLRYLDISSTNVRLDSNLTALLRTYDKLEHLVLDRVNLFGFLAREKGGQLCREFGGVCVLSGLQRGKERERQIAAWETAERTRIAEEERERARLRQPTASDEESDNEETEGARVAAVAAEEHHAAVTAARNRRRGHRSMAFSTFSIRERSSRNASSSTASAIAASIPLPPPTKLSIVLPPLPTLRSVSVGGEVPHMTDAKMAEWQREFQRGWAEAVQKIVGWAMHCGERYDRAVKKADDWEAANELDQLKNGSKGASGSSSTKHPRGKDLKSKAKTSPATVKVKPPLNVRLFRFPSPDEALLEGDWDSSKPVNGLVEVFSSEEDWRSRYTQALVDAEAWCSVLAEPATPQEHEQRATDVGLAARCVFCPIPDCEGPVRRGAEGEKMDGLGGMRDDAHPKDCGHMLGRATWGWQGVQNGVW